MNIGKYSFYLWRKPFWGIHIIEPMHMTNQVMSRSRQYFERSSCQTNNIYVEVAFMFKYADPNKPHPGSSILGTMPTGIFSNPGTGTK